MSDRVRALLVVEFIALLIGLAMPLTPSKTGSTWSPAELFVADPGYLDEALAGFVTVNVIVVLLGVAAWIVSRFDGRE